MRINIKRYVSLLSLLLTLGATAADMTYHKGCSFAISGAGSYMLQTNDEMKQMMDSHVYPVFDVRVGLSTSPENGGLFESEYNYPAYGFGFTYSNLNNLAYSGSSHLNDMYDFYAYFDRDIIRKQKFSFGYELLFGAGFSDNKYDPKKNDLNEAINSHVVFDIGMGPYARFRLSPRFELDAALKFRHHSFGKLSYPNSGLNEFIGSVTARYYLEDAVSVRDTMTVRRSFEKGFAYEFYAGCGAERCVEEWDVYNKMEPDVSKKVSTINAYPKWFFSFHTTYRYAPRFSSGVGIDMYCSSQDYMSSLENCERILYGDESVDNAKYNRFNCGLSLVQNFHYSNFAVWVLLGTYIYNHTGVTNSNRILYQKVGIKYTFQKLAGFTLSMCCKTHHFSQAEMMEFGLAYKI